MCRRTAASDGRCRQLGSVADRELAEDVGEVCLDGASRDEQVIGDLRVAETVVDQFDDLEFFGGE